MGVIDLTAFRNDVGESDPVCVRGGGTRWEVGGDDAGVRCCSRREYGDGVAQWCQRCAIAVAVLCKFDNGCDWGGRRTGVRAETAVALKWVSAVRGREWRSGTYRD